jgi:hypothetical protein
MSQPAGLGVAGDTWVLTASGPRQIHTLVGRQHVTIVHGQPFTTTAEGARSLGEGPLVRLRTVEGYQLRLGPAQPVQRPDGAWSPAARLQPGDGLRLQRHLQASVWPIEEARELLHGLVQRARLVRDADGRLAVLLPADGYDPIELQRTLLRLGLPSRVCAEGMLLVRGAALLDLARMLDPEHPRAAELRRAGLQARESGEDDPFVAHVESVAADAHDELFTCRVPGVQAFGANGLVVQHA